MFDRMSPVRPRTARHRPVGLTTILAVLLLAASASAAIPRPQTASFATPPPAAASKEDLAAWRTKLATRRLEAIGWLRQYSAAGAFPINRVRPGKLNVFIDDQTGAICAVANLMKLSGHFDLVKDAAAKNNFLRLVDVHDGALYEWMLTSGLTQEEIGLIQEPYFLEQPREPAWFAGERKRLQTHFAKVLEQLDKATDKSLDTAMERLAPHLSGDSALLPFV